mmetsp:Transcript_14074/g.48484  ORF Transcript_14074/g.48484 Transcript_14074/m.48484 type:complete len:113 (-) Transcript_14074:206-544(-)
MFRLKLLQVECSMSYSALGEVEERWKMYIRRSSREWVCTIESPSDSELMFTFYSVVLKSPESDIPHLNDVEVWGFNGVLAPDVHYVVHQDIAVRNAAGWMDRISRITVSKLR